MKVFALSALAALLPASLGDPICEDSPPGWYDAFGDDCEWYNEYDDHCDLFGNDARNFGKVANEACCYCGGGALVTPSPTASPSVSPIPGPLTSPGVSGDPHFKTWTGERYDFHGVCDLVLLQNPGFAKTLGMDIHIRTKQTKSWSYISAAVLRIGEHTLEVRGGQDNSVAYWLDGVESSKLHDLAGYAVTYTRTNSLQHTFEVALDDDDEDAGSITIQTFKSFVRVDMHGVTHENFANSYGLMGAFGSGDKVARDKVTHIDDTIEFGLMWQVLPEEGNLFHNLEGPQAPEQCFVPKARSLRRRLSEADVSLEDAEIACSRVDADDFDICVFDVIATNDKEVAGAY